jgi:hypothetical protein
MDQDARRSGWDALGGAGAAVLRWVAGAWFAATRPLVRMWRSDDPLDDYGLVHLASVAGDALVALALADTVFFSVPAGEAKVKVALYLGLTMAPLAIAAPLLVPLLDRGGFRRVISGTAAGGRAVIAVLLSTRLQTGWLFPLAFALLVLSKIHAITKNGLTMAYAPTGEGLVRANARLGRIAVVGAALAAIPGIIALRLSGGAAALRIATVVYALAGLLILRLPQPAPPPIEPSTVSSRGRVPSLTTAAAGTAGLRGASGFLLFLLAFALRTGGQPRYWFGVLAGAALAGGFAADLVAPRLSEHLPEEGIVLGAMGGAGLTAVVAAFDFNLWTLGLFATFAGGATELGRLAFQALMQRSTPVGAQGKVFVRYEVVFQLAWVAGAFLAALLPISFHMGVIGLAAFYLLLGAVFLVRSASDPGDDPV